MPHLYELIQDNVSTWREERQIAATDREIDALVYELYGLTEDEIRIVEESSG